MDKIEKYLLTISGIGENTVKNIASDIVKIDPQLINNTNANRIRKALSQKSGLSKLTLADLKYNPRKHFKREIVDAILASLRQKLGKRIKFEIAGSYRRKSKYCGDIDIMYIGNFDMLQRLFNDKNPKGRIEDPYARGEHKITTMLKWGKYYYKCDFYNTTTAAWNVMLVHLTGNYVFNVYLRTQAQKLGYLLNQYGLFKHGKSIKINSEKKLFEILHVKWHAPEERSK